MTVEISNDELVAKIGEAHAHGVFYRVTFVKKSDGQIRNMVCRGGVKKGLKKKDGNNPEPVRGYDPKAYGLMNTYSIDSDGWRCFALDNLKSAKIFGVEYVVK